MASVVGLDWVDGVGEPLEVRSSVKFHRWEESALDDPKRFASDDLAAMGLPRLLGVTSSPLS